MSRSRYLPGWQDSGPRAAKAWIRKRIKGMKRRNREREKMLLLEYTGWRYVGWIFDHTSEPIFENKVMTKGYW
jgi:hypothetical protein